MYPYSANIPFMHFACITDNSTECPYTFRDVTLIKPINSQGSPYSVVQDRLEEMWTQLKMPDQLRLDMALKYTRNEHAFEMFSKVFFGTVCIYVSVR